MCVLTRNTGSGQRSNLLYPIVFITNAVVLEDSVEMDNTCMKKLCPIIIQLVVDIFLYKAVSVQGLFLHI